MTRFLLLVTALASGAVAVRAQSPGGFVSGQTLTAAELNAALSAKQDYPMLQATAIEAFHQAGDADYGAAIGRACAAGAAMLLGATTYPVSNFSGCAVASFVMLGTPGKSIIQRQSAGGGPNFFTVGATSVVIDGVKFDSNKAVVSANQWGVLFNTGGQSVTVTNSVFENNSGTLGACFALVSTGPAAGGAFSFRGNEVTGCGANGALFGSVSNGLIAGNNFHDNQSHGAFVGLFGSASGTNFATNIQVSDNRFVNNGVNGLSVGGISPPYVFGTPTATNVQVIGNRFQDNAHFDLTLMGDNLLALGNRLSQINTAPVEGIVCTSRWSRIEANDINLNGSNWGIDCGGSADMAVINNTVTVTSGTAIDVGGTVNDIARGNRLVLSGTAQAFPVFDVEADANLVPFPQHTSGLEISGNTIEMAASTNVGFTLSDGAGEFTGSNPVIFTNNKFLINAAVVPRSNLVTYFADGAALQISGNTVNGSSVEFTNPTGSNDVVVDNAYDQVSTFAGASATIRAVVSPLRQTYNAGGSILWVQPTAGGANYTGATVLTATCSGTNPTGVAMTPLISQGAIFGVRVSNVGSGCTGTPSVAATDSGGGSGATFAVTNIPKMLTGRQIQLMSASVTSIFQASGGATAFLNSPPLVVQPNNLPITLTGIGTNNWQVSLAALPTYTITTLPPNNNTTCSAAYNGAEARVTNSAVGKWQVRCNGTNWLFPDGTVVN